MAEGLRPHNEDKLSGGERGGKAFENAYRCVEGEVKAVRLLKELLKALDVVGVSIIGYMRTGKTNIAKCVCNLITELYGDVLSVYITDNYVRNLGYVISEYGDAEGYVVIVNDDMSYHKESRDKMLAYYLARIKHEFPKAKGVCVINICHYVTSVLPFFRVSTVRILTSIMGKYEINVAKELFDLEPLWDFYAIKSYDPIRHRFYALFNVFGYHEIVKPPICHFSFDEELE